MVHWICWRCGHYESNTPAFKSAPYLFKDLVRDDPEHFMRKYCSPIENKHNFSPTESQQRNKTTDDETEPIFIIKIMAKQSQIFFQEDVSLRLHGSYLRYSILLHAL